MTAHYNAPDREADLEASFSNRPDAEAYAEAYGGEVEARGTAFLVGRGADHVQAREDAANGDGSWQQGRDKRTVGADEPEVAPEEVESVATGNDDNGNDDGA